MTVLLVEDRINIIRCISLIRNILLEAENYDIYSIKNKKFSVRKSVTASHISSFKDDLSKDDNQPFEEDNIFRTIVKYMSHRDISYKDILLKNKDFILDTIGENPTYLYELFCKILKKRKVKKKSKDSKSSKEVKIIEDFKDIPIVKEQNGNKKSSPNLFETLIDLTPVKSIFDEKSKSVFIISVSNYGSHIRSSGTILPNNRILTLASNIIDKSKVKILYNNELFKCDVISKDNLIDICILQVLTDIKLPSINIEDKNIKINNKRKYYILYPYFIKEVHLEYGCISNINTCFIKDTFKFNPKGCSVIDGNFNLVCIVGKNEYECLTGNLNFLTKIDENHKELTIDVEYDNSTLDDVLLEKHPKMGMYINNKKVSKVVISNKQYNRMYPNIYNHKINETVNIIFDDKSTLKTKVVVY